MRMNRHDDPAPGVDGTPTTRIASEERLAVSSREHQTGAVRIRTITHSESRELPVLSRCSSVKIK